MHVALANKMCAPVARAVAVHGCVCHMSSSLTARSVRAGGTARVPEMLIAIIHLLSVSELGGAQVFHLVHCLRRGIVTFLATIGRGNFAEDFLFHLQLAHELV